MKDYRDILAVSGALPIFVGVLSVRATTVMTDFALFWFLAKDSLAFAAIGLGLIYFGIALGSPLQGILSDRFGIRPLLSLSAGLFLLVAAILFLVPLGNTFLLVFSFLLGFVRPGAQGFGRAAWQVLYQDEEDRLRAASLDALQSALVNGLAALFAVALAQLINPAILLVVTASIASFSSFLLSQSFVAKRLLEKQQKKKSGGDLFRLNSFRALILVQIGFFMTDGFLVVTLLFFAASIGQDALGGLFICLFLFGALVGAYLYGKKATRHLDHTLEIIKILPRYALSLLFLPLALFEPLFILPVLFLSGWARSGFTPSVQTYLQDIVPLKRLNEALAFMYVALVVGSGIGRLILGPLEGVALFVPTLLALMTFLLAFFFLRKGFQKGDLPIS